MFTWMRHQWTLPSRALLIILLPLLVFSVSNFLEYYAGQPAGNFAQPSLQNGAAEVAGRIKTLSAFLLFASLAIGVLICGASAFRILDKQSSKRVLAAYFLTVVAGTTVVLKTDAFHGTPYLDQAFACASFGRLDPAPSDRPAAEAQPPNAVHPVPNGAPTLTTRRLTDEDVHGRASSCAAQQYHILQMLIRILGGLLLFAMPAVVFGAITCVAAPVGGSAEERLEAWRLQTRRLSGFLYLAAAYMISGLFFTSTQLNWVTYSLHSDDVGPFRDYISGIVLNVGISNSLVIASYYLPVAFWLSSVRPAELKAGADDGESQASDPFKPLRIAATIFAPTFVALASELLSLGG